MNKDFNIHPKIFLYGLGMAGWSIMFNIISVMIIYFYLPSLDSGLPVLIPQINIFGVFTVFSMVLASGRIIDAFANPLIISGIGKFSIPPISQLYLVAFLAAFPVAVLGILPFTIVAEIAELDSRRTGEQKEGMFYAVRTFSDMLGQTLGVMIFAIFTIFGKDTGNDLGIRLSALMGMIVCIIAGVIFLFFKEIKKRQLCWKAALVVILVSTRKKENKLLSANIK